MTRLPGIARAKLLIAAYGRLICCLLFIVGILSLGGAAWAYAHPPTTTVTNHVNEQTIESTLQTSALVTGESSLYREGDRLRNQELYFTSATPNITLTHRTTTTPDASTRLSHTIELVTQATNGGTVFWERSRVLNEATGTSSNGSFNSSTTIDITELNEQLQPIASEIGSEGSVQVAIRVTTSYETDQYSGTLTDTANLRLSGASYSVAPLTLETTESTQTTRRVPIPSRNAFGYTFRAGIGIFAVISGGFVGVVQHRLPNEATLADQVQRLRYSEWISMGTIPSSVNSQPVRIETLDDLVDLAIDANKRVLLDEQQDVFAVIDGDVMYYYGQWPNPESTGFEWDVTTE